MCAPRQMQLQTNHPPICTSPPPSCVGVLKMAVALAEEEAVEGNGREARYSANGAGAHCESAVNQEAGKATINFGCGKFGFSSLDETKPSQLIKLVFFDEFLF